MSPTFNSFDIITTKYELLGKNFNLKKKQKWWDRTALKISRSQDDVIDNVTFPSIRKVSTHVE